MKESRWGYQAKYSQQHHEELLEGVHPLASLDRLEPGNKEQATLIAILRNGKSIFLLLLTDDVQPGLRD